MDTETNNPNIHFHDALTQETIERPMTDIEYELFLQEMNVNTEE